jgi:hypothetical protein
MAAPALDSYTYLEPLTDSPQGQYTAVARFLAHSATKIKDTLAVPHGG